MNKGMKFLGVPLLAATFGMGAAAAETLGKPDQRLLTDLAIANMAEVEVGRMALEKSQNAQVKAFAQQMVDDHGKGLEEVRKVAQAKNFTLPTELDSKHKAMASKLQALSGDKFDRTYMDQAGVKSHHEAHKLVAKTESSALDSDVKALGAKLQPTIQQHMNKAEQLNAAIKGGTSVGASGTQGEMGSSAKPKQSQSSGNTDHPENPANPTTQPPAPVKK